jgi:hypothetical protein
VLENLIFVHAPPLTELALQALLVLPLRRQGQVSLPLDVGAAVELIGPAVGDMVLDGSPRGQETAAPAGGSLWGHEARRVRRSGRGRALRDLAGAVGGRHFNRGVVSREVVRDLGAAAGSELGDAGRRERW